MLELVTKLLSPSWWIEQVAGALVGMLLLPLLLAPRFLLWSHAAAATLAIGYCTIILPPGVSIEPRLDWFSERILLPMAIAVCVAAPVGVVAILGSASSQRVVSVILSAWAVLVAYAAEVMHLEWATHIVLWVALHSYAKGAALLALLLSLPIVMRAVVRGMAEPQATI